MAKVLIVDTFPAAREGLAARIAAHFDLEVCGQAADTGEAMDLVRSTSPDVVVLDFALKEGNGLDLIRRIRAHDRKIQILVWSIYPDALYAARALQAGALGYVHKQNPTERIVEAIRTVRDGTIYLCDEMSQALLARTVGVKRLKPTGVASLSECELEVFRLIGQGVSTRQIAHRLHRSTHTVESHRHAIKRKLNLHTAAELNRAAVQWVLENG